MPFVDVVSSCSSCPSWCRRGAWNDDALRGPRIFVLVVFFVVSSCSVEVIVVVDVAPHRAVVARVKADCFFAASCSSYPSWCRRGAWNGNALRGRRVFVLVVFFVVSSCAVELLVVVDVAPHRAVVARAKADRFFAAFVSFVFFVVPSWRVEG